MKYDSQDEDGSGFDRLFLKKIINQNFGLTASKEDIPVYRHPEFEAFEYMYQTSLRDSFPVAIARNGFGGNLPLAGVMLSISHH